MAVAVDLAADLTVAEVVGVDVGVHRVGLQRAHELVELAGGDALIGRADHVGRHDRARHFAGRRAGGLAATAAQERDHSAVHSFAPEVDVGELHR